MGTRDCTADSSAGNGRDAGRVACRPLPGREIRPLEPVARSLSPQSEGLVKSGSMTR